MDARRANGPTEKCSTTTDERRRDDDDEEEEEEDATRRAEGRGKLAVEAEGAVIQESSDPQKILPKYLSGASSAKRFPRCDI